VVRGSFRRSLTVVGNTVYGVTNTGKLYAYNATTGAAKCSFDPGVPLPALYCTRASSYDDGAHKYLYLAANYNDAGVSKSYILSIHDDGDANCAQTWQTSQPLTGQPKCGRWSRRLVFIIVTGAIGAAAFDRTDGSRLWTMQFGPLFPQFFPTPRHRLFPRRRTLDPAYELYLPTNNNIIIALGKNYPPVFTSASLTRIRCPRQRHHSIADVVMSDTNGCSTFYRTFSH